jgi:hypothetical protein
MTRRPTDWRNSFRALNRGPFALGLLCLLTAAMGVLGLVGTSITGVRPFRGEWWDRRGSWLGKPSLWPQSERRSSSSTTGSVTRDLPGVHKSDVVDS